MNWLKLFKRDRRRTSDNVKRAMPAEPAIHYRGILVPTSGGHIPDSVIDQLVRDDYEAPELLGIEGVIQNGDRILELGCGLGVVSALASRMASDIGVLSFEANPELMEPINRLHALNGIDCIEVINAMLKHNPTLEIETFSLHRYFPEGSVIKSEFTQKEVSVSVMPFEETISSFKPTVLICDIDGGESELLVDSDLSSFRAAVIEMHPNVTPQPEINAIFDNFARCGLKHVRDLSTANVEVFLADNLKTARPSS
ncbi:FkbM family methyltransferase [Roseovarius aquimarinus]|uniref:FkbM family methyltransferase n=1 Tax=Roseovarius aquimarinus TaxID=1229156 RepID=A0ABW7I9L5_9RHOB